MIKKCQILKVYLPFDTITSGGLEKLVPTHLIESLLFIDVWAFLNSFELLALMSF